MSIFVGRWWSFAIIQFQMPTLVLESTLCLPLLDPILRQDIKSRNLTALLHDEDEVAMTRPTD